MASGRGWSCSIIPAMVLTMTYLAHGQAPSPALIAGAPAGMMAMAMAPGPAGNVPVSVLFVLQADNATLTPVAGEAGNYTMKASGVSTRVVAFTDTPVRFASTINVGFFTSDPRFVVNGAWLDNPNVAMTAANLSTASTPQVTVMTLFSPTFDNKTNTLTAKVRTVEKPENLANKPKPEISFYFDSPEAKKRASKIAGAATPAATTWFKPSFFIDNLSTWGDDYTSTMMDGGYNGIVYGGSFNDH